MKKHKKRFVRGGSGEMYDIGHLNKARRTYVRAVVPKSRESYKSILGTDDIDEQDLMEYEALVIRGMEVCPKGALLSDDGVLIPALLAFGRLQDLITSSQEFSTVYKDGTRIYDHYKVVGDNFPSVLGLMIDMGGIMLSGMMDNYCGYVAQEHSRENTPDPLTFICHHWREIRSGVIRGDESLGSSGDVMKSEVKEEPRGDRIVDPYNMQDS